MHKAMGLIPITRKRKPGVTGKENRWMGIGKETQVLSVSKYDIIPR